MSAGRFLLVMIAVISSFALLLGMFTDGSTYLPAYMMDYQYIFFLIWLIGSLLGLWKAS